MAVHISLLRPFQFPRGLTPLHGGPGGRGYQLLLSIP